MPEWFAAAWLWAAGGGPRLELGGEALPSAEVDGCALCD